MSSPPKRAASPLSIPASSKKVKREITDPDSNSDNESPKRKPQPTSGKASKERIPTAALRLIAQELVERGRVGANVAELAEKTGLTTSQIRKQIAKQRANVYAKMMAYAESLE